MPRSRRSMASMHAPSMSGRVSRRRSTSSPRRSSPSQAITWRSIMRRHADRFMAEIERATRLDDAYHAAMRLPASPYNRLLREGINFFSELKPGGLKDNGPAVATQTALTTTQLEALRMVLAKEVAAERDAAARFIPWLATFGSVSPLLGLLGTVLGVMDAFIGIAVGGSGNIAAVAPGVAEAL